MFYYEHNRITASVTGNNLAQLTEKVKGAFSNNGIPIPEDLQVIIEHQICVCQDNPTEVCWSGGIGDDLHNKWIGPFLKRLARAMDTSEEGVISRARRAVAKTAEKIAGCSSCKGSRVYQNGKNNLGRAGTLNKIG